MNDPNAARSALRGRGFVAAVFLGCAGLVALAGCDHSSSPPAAASQPAAKPITLRGVIQELPFADAPRHLRIRNEAAKEMGEMSMNYSADPSLSLTGLAVGDKVSFDWVEEDGDRVIQIKKLPADTVLSFEKPETKPAAQP